MSADIEKYFEQMTAKLYSAALSDILDEIGCRNQVISPGLGIRPLKNEWVLVGRAKTLFNEPSDKTEDPYELAIAGLDQMEKGQILVAGGPVIDLGIMGELSAHRMLKRGGRGAIVNGFSRDISHLLRLDFPIFCKGGTPIDTTGRSRVTAVDVPIPFGDKEIEPGEIIFADLDGIIKIPREIEEEVILKALTRVDEENRVRSDIKNGSSFREVWERYHIL